MTPEERKSGFVLDYEAIIKRWGYQWATQVEWQHEVLGPAIMTKPIITPSLVPLNGWVEPTQSELPDLNEIV